MRRIVSSFALVSVPVMPNAHAVFDPPWITPAAPTTSDIVSVSIQGGGCDAIVERPGYPQVTRNGNQIHVIVYGVRAYDDWCILPRRYIHDADWQVCRGRPHADSGFRSRRLSLRPDDRHARRYSLYRLGCCASNPGSIADASLEVCAAGLRCAHRMSGLGG